MNNEAIKQKTNELAELLRNSDEHRIYTVYCKPVFRRERLPVRIAARK